MFQKTMDKAYWLGLNRIIGIEAILYQDVPQLYACLMRKTSQGISVEESQRFLDWNEVETFAQSHPELPIYLNVYGRFVMEKWLRGRTPVDKDVLGMLANRSDDFCIQYLSNNGQTHIGAAIRKDKLEEIWKELPTVANRVVSVNISSGNMIHLLSLLLPDFHTTDYELSINEQNYYFLKGQFAEKTARQSFQPLTLSDLAAEAKVEVAELSLLAHAIQLMYQYQPELPTEELVERYEIYTWQSRTRKQLKIAAVVIGLFALSVLGTWVGLGNTIQNLQKEYQANQSVLLTIEANRKQIQEQEDILERFQTESLKATQVSWYLDRIAMNRPTGIRLSHTLYKPDDELLKRTEVADSSAVDIIIRGLADKSSAITAFSLQLEQADWTKQVNLVRSDYNFEEEHFQFVLTLTIQS